MFTDMLWIHPTCYIWGPVDPRPCLLTAQQHVKIVKKKKKKLEAFHILSALLHYKHDSELMMSLKSASQNHTFLMFDCKIFTG